MLPAPHGRRKKKEAPHNIDIAARRFSVAAPRLELSTTELSDCSIRKHFKNRLKTFLFSLWQRHCSTRLCTMARYKLIDWWGSGSWQWIHQVAAPCSVIRGSGVTCHWIRPNVCHIGILHLVSISTTSPQSTCHSAPVSDILSKSDHPRKK